MNQLTAIVDGKRCTMLTEESIEGAEQSCRDRFGARFEGFAPIPIQVQARIKWNDYRERRITRQQLEDWLKQQSEADEQRIRTMYNGLRG